MLVGEVLIVDLVQGLSWKADTLPDSPKFCEIQRFITSSQKHRWTPSSGNGFQSVIPQPISLRSETGLEKSIMYSLASGYVSGKLLGTVIKSRRKLISAIPTNII
jgi:hypothetical protein